MASPRLLARPLLITILVLAIPFVAKQLTAEMQWSGFDFIAMGALVFGTTTTFEIVARRGRNTQYRAATALALLTGFLLIWINLAVGIIGSEDNPANGLYQGVFVVGAVGAAISRLRPLGMSRTLFATAAAQALVPFVAMAIQRPLETDDGGLLPLFQVLFLNLFFVLLFVVAGALYRAAHNDEDAAPH